MRTSAAVANTSSPSDHHHRLELLYERVVQRFRDGDSLGAREGWFLLEIELLDHLAEEEEMFPGFARFHPAEAEALRAEHETLRSRLFEMSVELDLHLLRAEAVQEFGALLRDHARREEATLYSWAEAASRGSAQDLPAALHRAQEMRAGNRRP